MKNMLFCIFVGFFIAPYACASDLDAMLQKTYVSCVGIDDMLADMKKMAGINTAVTGVGTVAGVGALIVGIEKTKQLDKLRDIEDDGVPGSSDEVEVGYNQNFTPNPKSTAKKLGNWRTGLLAANTATNVVGAVIAGKNANNTDLKEKIDDCIKSVDDLYPELMRARMDNIDITEAKSIYNSCSEYKYLDLSVLQKRVNGALASSIVGGGVGAAGVVTSAVANKSGGDKEKKLDNVSNVLAGGTTVLSGVATVFNAMQISAIKKLSSVAQKCESALK